MAIPFIFRCNTNGFPMIESRSVNVSATAVTFDFDSHPVFRQPFTGGFFVKITQPIPAGTTTTLPIVFSADGINKVITTYNGAEITVADFKGTGIYLFFYDNSSNTLQLID